MHILVVDDEAFIPELITELMAESGHSTRTARDGHEALAVLGDEADRFDVVLTDLHMPGMSGLDLASQISGRWPDLPIVALSAYLDALTDMPEPALRAHGIRVVLQKPCSSVDLEAALQSVARQRSDAPPADDPAAPLDESA